MIRIIRTISTRNPSGCKFSRDSK